MHRLPRLSQIPSTLTAEAFWSVVGSMEHESLDFKESANHVTDAISAMAMTDGGLLVLGVSDRRELKGCPLDQRTFDRVMRAAHACHVGAVPQETTVDGVRLTVVAVPEVRGRIVTTPDGRLLRRVGSDNQPL